MPGQEQTIFQRDPAFLRHKLETGEIPTFVINVDENLKLVVVFSIYEGNIAGQVFQHYKDINGDWITEEGVDLSLESFCESDSIVG